jgi:hypothetical protein
LRADWRETARRAGFPVGKADTTTVELHGGGSQRVEFKVDEINDALRATSIIAAPSVLGKAAGDSAHRYAWVRNRLSDLVGFSVDRRGRLIGEAWIPLEGLTPDEFGLYVSELARVCDWHEFRLTGEDVY